MSVIIVVIINVLIIPKIIYQILIDSLEVFLSIFIMRYSSIDKIMAMTGNKIKNIIPEIFPFIIG